MRRISNLFNKHYKKSYFPLILIKYDKASVIYKNLLVNRDTYQDYSLIMAFLLTKYEYSIAIDHNICTYKNEFFIKDGCRMVRNMLKILFDALINAKY